MKKDIYIFNDGDLRRKDNTFYFQSGETKKYLPIEELDSVWVFGEVTVNKKFLDFASQKGILIHFFNYYEYYTGTFYPREHLNSGYVILKQAEAYLQEEKRVLIAKKIIRTAINNILVVLKYYSKRGKDLKEVIADIEEKWSLMEDCSSTAELMAYEGNIRESYYKAFNIILDEPDFVFTNRSRRPPKDKINALISFGNSMMYTTVLSEIYQTNLDPRIGYLHATNNRRFSLNLDLAEIFKPVIVDRVIFSLINKRVITAKDFDNNFGGILLKDSGKKKFIEEYNKKLLTTIHHKSIGTAVSYKRLIRLEAYKLQKLITEDADYEGFVCEW
ncbi:type I-B CRISPR-associated endonuclease Cas1b [Diplocloster agilis]|uniref:type I-B CRISPR-associated endonuclease Cas1b n=1 Tax=Diplocloster agilis TaxID=2850323 RepID=UPI0008221CE5|nr:type I-B CRISPR-associated endonuclease Cas1b [Suonthocola fibrivorans]MCU6735331.1 type I-B CRISPR-associated endonuclease Cas1b [Suonthocola fibrivorans]SCJ70975.1 CRISPR-associated endonuclease Cas1%2C subtype I-B/HMARI/TNEAP [uncultured Clostridium sp.]